MPQINVPKREMFDPKRNIPVKEKGMEKFLNRLSNARNEETKKKEMLNNLGKEIKNHRKDKHDKE
jgi:hypothetical protein